MMHRFRMQRFKGHTDTTVELGRLTMLVGDNASGKTSVLQALQMHGQVVTRGTLGGHPKHRVQRGASEPIRFLSEGSHAGNNWNLDATVGISTNEVHVAGHIGDQALKEVFVYAEDGKLHTQGPNGKWDKALVSAAIGAGRLYRFNGTAVAMPSAANESKRVLSTGRGTARVLAHLRLADDSAFSAIQQAARAIVPSLRAIRIDDYVEGSEEEAEYERGAFYRILLSFDGCDSLPASEASQGTLVTLALLTVLYGPDRPGVIMLDDFDHALHPRAQMELVRTLRRLLEHPDFTELQIIATTHSPYVLDELEPSEVQVFALRPDGTVASKRLSEHPEAQKSPGSLRTGELWTLDAERDWVLKG